MSAAHWMPLTADAAERLYGVTAQAAGRTCYELSSRARSAEGSEGPWPLLAFTRDSPQPGLVSLEWAMVDVDRQPGTDPDPFRRPGNYLLLDGPAVRVLVEFLESLPVPVAKDARLPPFVLLDRPGVAAWGLADRQFEEHRQSFLVRPAVAGVSETVALVFSAPEPLPAHSLFVAVERPGSDPHPRPDDPPAPALVLDGAGLRWFAALIAAELPHLEMRRPG